ncbi:MAG TPA: PliI family lysozyme inhibitor of I-type lysozyme, partial [Gammaproteobacteria bacterium]
TLRAENSDASQPFFAQMVLQGVTFQVESPNEGSINQVKVRADGPSGPIGAMEAEADGTITNVEVEDLNADGYPEIYVYVNSAGSGSYGSLIAYASNRNRSLSEIYLPPLEDDPDASKGYMGHDTFAVGEGALLRRFPVYREGDTNAEPSGGTRQVQYRLEAGEAGWRLVPYNVVDF